MTGAVQGQTLVVLGDSLSAGYRMEASESWPSILPEALEEAGKPDIKVVNASISGDTTGNGLDRLTAVLDEHNPDWVLIELGANDGLRGFSPKVIRTNLDQIIRQVQDAGSTPILMQIQVPPNYGKRYSEAFAHVYPSLSVEYDVPLLPFFLEQVILKKGWMMDDGLHPKPEAQPWIADHIAGQLTPLLADRK